MVANIFNEVNALPGWLECHLPVFDDVRVLHAGPQGAFSTDGTIELLERWRVPVKFSSIDAGFGAVRTEAVRYSPCDYVVVLDADERLHGLHRVLRCSGTTPEAHDVLHAYEFKEDGGPDWDYIDTLGADLRVEVGEPYDQAAYLRGILECGSYDAVVACRRHWHGLGHRRPTQNWFMEPDWQLRIVRRRDDVYFDSGTKMHERLVGAKNFFRADLERGPFFDHHHFHFKRMEPEQRRHDITIYNALHCGEVPPTCNTKS